MSITFGQNLLFVKIYWQPIAIDTLDFATFYYSFRRDETNVAGSNPVFLKEYRNASVKFKDFAQQQKKQYIDNKKNTKLVNLALFAERKEMRCQKHRIRWYG